MSYRSEVYNHLSVLWLEGALNVLGDLFTEIQPIERHVQGMGIIAVAVE